MLQNVLLYFAVDKLGSLFLLPNSVAVKEGSNDLDIEMLASAWARGAHVGPRVFSHHPAPRSLQGVENTAPSLLFRLVSC